MASIISAGTTSGTSLNLSGDTSGVLQLATNGSTTAVTVDTSQNVGIGTTAITSSAGWSPRLVLAGTDTALIVKGGSGQENSFGASGGLYIDCLGNSTATNNNIVFRNTNVNSNFTALERMRINASGDVGIGTSSPTDSAGFGRALDLNGSAGAAYYARTNGSATSWTVFGNYGVDGYVNNRGAGSLQFYNNNAERMRIDSNGRVTMPYQPAFMARTYLGNGSTIGGSVALRFTDIDINRGNHFNNTTGIFTCPVAGLYFVYFNFNLRATVGDWTSAFIIRNSTIIIQSWSKPNIDFEYGNTVASCILNCAANDTIALAYSPSYSAPNTPSLYNHASIYLLG